VRVRDERKREALTVIVESRERGFST